MKKSFYPGDLVETITHKGETIYGIVIESTERYHFGELRVLLQSRISGLVYDGTRGTIRLIQRGKNEKRTSK